MPLPIALRQWRRFRSTTAVLTLSGAVTLGLMLLAGFIMLLARGDITRDADKDALNIARAAGQDIARNLELYDLQLRSVAGQMQNPGVQALPPELRHAVLFAGVTHDEHVGFINVLDEHGDVIADSAGTVPRGGHWFIRDYFQAQRNSSTDTLFIGKPFGDEGKSMIPLSRRLTRPDGNFAGVVVGSARLDYFSELFKRFAVGAHGTITLLLDNGMIVQRIPAAPNEIGHIPRLNLLTAARDAEPVNLADPVDAQVRRFVLYRPKGLPLALAVGLAPAEVYAAWNSRAAAILSAILALGLLNAVLLWRLHRAAIKQQADEQELRNWEGKLREQGLQLRQLAEQHTATVEAEKQAHKDRVRLLDEVTHDMRTLLHGALTHAELIPRNGPLNPEQADHLASIHDDVEHLRDVAERFLLDARDGRATGLLLDPTDICGLVGQCRRMVSIAAEEKNLQLVFQTGAGLPGRVVTDGRRLGVILSNLLDNAIRHTEAGSVAVHTSLEKSGLCFVIKDTGRGMPEAQKQRLLGEGNDADEAFGTTHGRGLSIVRRHVEALGGSINCLHNPDGGTIVSLTVPVTPAIAPEPRNTSAPERRTTVLVVDDSAISRKPTADLLRANGYRVTEAASGEAALRLAGDNDFDLLLMDGRMAGMSGPETARRIRALPKGRGSMPIIVLSATPRRDGLQAWQPVSISFYIEKATEPDELLKAVRRLARPPAASRAHPAGLSPDAVDDSQLRSFGKGVLSMRNLLDSGVPAADQAMITETAHRTGGDAGQLGFTALAAECRRFEQAREAGTEPASARATLIGAVDDVLLELRQRFQEPMKGEARSAMPTT